MRDEPIETFEGPPPRRFRFTYDYQILGRIYLLKTMEVAWNTVPNCGDGDCPCDGRIRRWLLGKPRLSLRPSTGMSAWRVARHRTAAQRPVPAGHQMSYGLPLPLIQGPQVPTIAVGSPFFAGFITWFQTRPQRPGTVKDMSPLVAFACYLSAPNPECGAYDLRSSSGFTGEILGGVPRSSG